MIGVTTVAHGQPTLQPTARKGRVQRAGRRSSRRRPCTRDAEPRREVACAAPPPVGAARPTGRASSRARDRAASCSSPITSACRPPRAASGDACAARRSRIRANASPAPTTSPSRRRHRPSRPRATTASGASAAMAAALAMALGRSSSGSAKERGEVEGDPAGRARGLRPLERTDLQSMPRGAPAGDQRDAETRHRAWARRRTSARHRDPPWRLARPARSAGRARTPPRPAPRGRRRATPDRRASRPRAWLVGPWPAPRGARGRPSPLRDGPRRAASRCGPSEPDTTSAPARALRRAAAGPSRSRAPRRAAASKAFAASAGASSCSPARSR